MDLSKSSQAIINTNSLNERLDCDENKPFFDRLDPVLDQMKAANICKE